MDSLPPELIVQDVRRFYEMAIESRPELVNGVSLVVRYGEAFAGVEQERQDVTEVAVIRRLAPGRCRPELVQPVDHAFEIAAGSADLPPRLHADSIPRTGPKRASPPESAPKSSGAREEDRRSPAARQSIASN